MLARKVCFLGFSSEDQYNKLQMYSHSGISALLETLPINPISLRSPLSHLIPSSTNRRHFPLSGCSVQPV